LASSKQSLKRLGERIKRNDQTASLLFCCCNLYTRLEYFYYSKLYASQKKETKKLLSRETFKCTGHAIVTFRTEQARYLCLREFHKPRVNVCCKRARGSRGCCCCCCGPSSNEPSGLERLRDEVDEQEMQDMSNNNNKTNVPNTTTLQQQQGGSVAPSTYTMNPTTTSTAEPFIPTKSFTTKYKNKKLKVDPAKAPKDLNWQNFEFSNCAKTCRRSVSIFVSCAAILIATGLAFVLEMLRQAASKSFKIHYQIIASVAISIVIYILSTITTFVLYYVSEFERHRFESRRRRSLMYKLSFATLFIQLISLLVNISVNSQINIMKVPVPYVEINPSFYYSCCTYILISAISNTLKDAFMPIFHYIKKRYLAFGSVTQGELNEAFIPPEYSLEYRYSYILSTCMFGIVVSGMWPFGLFILSLGLLTSQLVDKYNLFRVYRKFDQSDDLLSKGAIKCITVAFMLRFAFVLLLRISSTITVAINFNYYIIVCIMCGFAYAAFYLYEYVLNDLDLCGVPLCNICCGSIHYNGFKRPRFVTRLGLTPIDRWAQLDAYSAPVLPSEVRHEFTDEGMYM